MRDAYRMCEIFLVRTMLQIGHRSLRRGIFTIGISLCLLVSCNWTPGSDGASAKVTVSVPLKNAPKAPASLLQFCGKVAASVPRKRRGEIQEQRVALPPMLYDEPTLSSAERRLRALKAIDALKSQLSERPHDAQLHHQLGLIFRDFMKKPDTALAHFCRALLEAPRIRDYRLAALSQLMEPGEEPRLELALRPGDRSLPWRKALAEARSLTGVSSADRAEAFWYMLRGQRMVRTAKSIRRRRIVGKPIDLVPVLESWAGMSVDSLRITVNFVRRHRRKVLKLRNRSQALRGVFASPGPAGRWIVLAENDNARGAILTASELLAGVDLGVSAIAGERQVYLVGQFSAGSFIPRYLAMDPHNRDFEAQIVVPPEIPATQ